MARLFFALWPDEETRAQLNHAAQQFKNENLRLVKPSNLHITLEFLGEVSEEDQQGLENKVSQIQSDRFQLKLTRTGFWKKPQILWIGTTHTPKPLLNLVKSIKNCVKQQGLKTDKREYKPHVTIARKAKQPVVSKETFCIPWHATSFVLVVSKSTDSGVDYQVLREWPLKA